MHPVHSKQVQFSKTESETKGKVLAKKKLAGSKLGQKVVISSTLIDDRYSSSPLRAQLKANPKQAGKVAEQRSWKRQGDSKSRNGSYSFHSCLGQSHFGSEKGYEKYKLKQVPRTQLKIKFVPEAVGQPAPTNPRDNYYKVEPLQNQTTIQTDDSPESQLALILAKLDYLTLRVEECCEKISKLGACVDTKNALVRLTRNHYTERSLALSNPPGSCRRFKQTSSCLS